MTGSVTLPPFVGSLFDPAPFAPLRFRPLPLPLLISSFAFRSLEKAVKAIRASEGKPVAVELLRDGAKPVVRTVKVRHEGREVQKCRLVLYV